MTSHVPVVDHRHDYWRRTRRLTLWLMALWFATTFCVIFFARELYTITVFGWPVSFYMAAQGNLLIYLAIVGIHAWRMRVLDKRYEAAQASRDQTLRQDQAMRRSNDEK